MTDPYEDTGSDSSYAQESIVTGPHGEGGLSASRLGEANAGHGSPKHPALYALGCLGVGVAVIVVLVFLLVYDF